MKLVVALAIIPAIFVGARPANDWSKPCFNGECAYDLPQDGRSASGTMKIFGTADLIKDITPAAGWVILGCDRNKLEQDITIVCSDNTETSDGCSRLFSGSGPVSKLVRLPEECGSSPFARIAEAWIPDDQSAGAKLAARDGSVPKVHTLRIDTNFAAASQGDSKSGTVSFVFQGSTLPGAPINIEPLAKELTALKSRGEDSFDAVLAQSLKDLEDWDFNRQVTFPFNLSKNVTLIDQHLTCPNLNASFTVNVTGHLSGQASAGIAISGTIFPPALTRFSLTAGFQADLGGSVVVVAALRGAVDTGDIVLVQLGLPGLGLPGFFSLGPQIQITGRAAANLNLAANATAGVNYHLAARVLFPPQGNSFDSSFQIQNTPLTVSAGANAVAQGSVEAHITPRLTFGLTAFGSTAGFFIAVDPSVNASFDAHAGASASASVGRRSYIPPHAVDIASRQISGSASTSAGVCVGVDANLGVVAGAQGSLFGLWNPSLRIPIYNHTWHLVEQKCANASISASTRPTTRSLEARSPDVLQCLAQSSAAVSLVNQNVLPRT